MRYRVSKVMGSQDDQITVREIVVKPWVRRRRLIEEFPYLILVVDSRAFILGFEGPEWMRRGRGKRQKVSSDQETLTTFTTEMP